MFVQRVVCSLVVIWCGLSHPSWWLNYALIHPSRWKIQPLTHTSRWPCLASDWLLFSRNESFICESVSPPLPGSCLPKSCCFGVNLQASFRASPPPLRIFSEGVSPWGKALVIAFVCCDFVRSKRRKFGLQREIVGFEKASPPSLAVLLPKTWFFGFPECRFVHLIFKL